MARERGVRDLAPTSRWRGVLEEPGAEPERLTPAPRHGSRRLLAELLRPHRRRVALVIAVVLVENAARLSLPWLVALGIDRGLPPISRDSGRALLPIVAAMVVAVVLQSLGRITFLRISGRIGQDVLLELRRRVFAHFQRLDVAFHDRYTSGRVTSRLTSDVDAITELLAGGFDGLVTAVLTMVGVGILMLCLDLELGARVPAVLPDCWCCSCAGSRVRRPRSTARYARRPPWSSCSSSRR